MWYYTPFQVECAGIVDLKELLELSWSFLLLSSLVESFQGHGNGQELCLPVNTLMYSQNVDASRMDMQFGCSLRHNGHCRLATLCI